MSFRLPPVSETASGVPRPQATDPESAAAWGTFGINGSISSHSSSDTTGRAIVPSLSHEVDGGSLRQRTAGPCLSVRTRSGC
jgi:hypothetical protein